MTTLEKMRTIFNQYVRAYENNNESMMNRMANRANDLYRETYGTEYSMTSLREKYLFNIANNCRDFFFISDLRKIKF